MEHTLESVVGVLCTAFFALIWYRLNNIDANIRVIMADMRMHYGATQKLEGRVDEISHKGK